MNDSDLHAALDDDVALGFSLAGLKDIFVVSEDGDPEGLKDWFNSRIRMGGGVILLSGAAASLLREELFARRAMGAVLPVVVVLPGSGEDPLARDLVRRAIGMMPDEEG